MIPLALVTVGIAWSAACFGAGVSIGTHLERKARTAETPSDSPDRIRAIIEYRAAIHEAGHAICAWYAPHTARLVKVTIDNGFIGEGFTEYMRTVSRTTNTALLWHEMAVDLGGIAAELVEFGKTRSGGARNDLIRAKTNALQIVKHQRPPEPPWNKPAALPKVHFDVSAMLKSLDEGDEAARILNIGLARAKYLIEKDRRRHLKLAALLITESPLNEEDLKKFFGQRSLLHWIRTWPARHGA